MTIPMSHWNLRARVKRQFLFLSVKNNMSEHKKFFYVKALSLVGIILALYLLWEQLFHPSVNLCSINSTVNCDAIISGSVAKMLGLPTPLYGLIGYIVMLIAAYLAKKKLLLGMATFGLVFCMSIAYIETFQLHVVCPVCLLCDVVIISVFSFAVSLNRHQKIKK